MNTDIKQIASLIQEKTKFSDYYFIDTSNIDYNEVLKNLFEGKVQYLTPSELVVLDNNLKIEDISQYCSGTKLNYDAVNNVCTVALNIDPLCAIYLIRVLTTRMIILPLICHDAPNKEETLMRDVLDKYTKVISEAKHYPQIP